MSRFFPWKRGPDRESHEAPEPTSSAGHIEQRVVDNRVFLLGLDDLYREAMKPHERGELLACAHRVSEALDVGPANVPIEGYYTEDADLTEYFRLIRALQGVSAAAEPSVSSLSEFQRLRAVCSSPLFGPAQESGKLLPTGRDALSQALKDAYPDWTVANLVAIANKVARERDEISLVGLAARICDAVVLTATRESVVLYAERFVGAARRPRRPKYVWKVSPDLSQLARRFIDTFRSLFGEALPPPDAEHAAHYWAACQNNRLFGRCVRIGSDDSTSPVRHYHWAIATDSRDEYLVHEFWDREVWTTDRYRRSSRRPDRPEGR